MAREEIEIPDIEIIDIEDLDLPDEELETYSDFQETFYYMVLEFFTKANCSKYFYDIIGVVFEFNKDINYVLIWMELRRKISNGSLCAQYLTNIEIKNGMFFFVFDFLDNEYQEKLRKLREV